MSQILAILKNKEGHFLAQVTDFEEKILIGSGDKCHLSIPDPQVKNIEIEVAFIDGAYWMHVSKESDPAIVEGTQIREIKIEKDTAIHFKDYILEIIFKSETNQPEKTRIVESTRVDKTLEIETIVTRSDELTFSRLNNEESDKTRILDQKTRIVSQEDQRDLFSSRGQPLNKQREDAILEEIKENNSGLFSKFSTFLSEIFVFILSFGNFLRPYQFLLVLFLLIVISAAFMLRPRQNKSLEAQTEVLVDKPHNANSMQISGATKSIQNIKSATLLENSTIVPIQTVSKEAYLNSMDALFEKELAK